MFGVLRQIESYGSEISCFGHCCYRAKSAKQMLFFCSDMNSGQQAEKLFFNFQGCQGSLFQIIQMPYTTSLVFLCVRQALFVLV